MKQILSESSFRIKKCRVCGSTRIKKAIDLGKQPVANNFPKYANTVDKKYPLFTVFCDECFTHQIGYTVDRDELFAHYLYVSSVSPKFIKHFEDLAKYIHEEYKPNLVFEIGSNDGIFLKPMSKYSRVVGIEPAENLAKQVRDQGFEVYNGYIDDKKTVKVIAGRYGQADVIVACNVFAHIDDIENAIANTLSLLKEDGILIIEVAHMLKMLENNYFDTVYHEHFFYWTVYALSLLLMGFGGCITRIEEIDTHGGSIRVFIQKGIVVNPEVYKNVLSKEIKADLNYLETYKNMNKKCQQIKKDLMNLLTDLKKQGNHIVGYGAPAKGNTLLNFVGIDHTILDFIIDDAEIKQGRFTPGSKIQIKSNAEVAGQLVDYILILAWNFAEPIMKELKAKGYQGKFILPLPEPKII